MPIDMKALAAAGARARLAELQQGIEEIRRAFPQLGSAEEAGRPAGTGRRRGRQASSQMDGSESAQQDQPKQRRTRTPMTAAQKKAVGERMREYWAARKRGEKKG